MRNALRLTASALLLAAFAGAPAFAMDEMKKDSMSKGAMHHDGAKDGMKKEPGHHDSIAKDGMKDGMAKKDSMKKDDMKK